jgi:hypothetical protein
MGDCDAKSKPQIDKTVVGFLEVTPDKQLQRTVMDKVPRHMRQRAAAQLRRCSMSDDPTFFRSLLYLLRILMLRFKPNLGDLVGPLIHADEIAKRVPRYRDAGIVSIDDLRRRVNERYGHDLVGSVMNAPIFGALTIETQARAVVQRYADSSPTDDWADRLI